MRRSLPRALPEREGGGRQVVGCQAEGGDGRQDRHPGPGGSPDTGSLQCDRRLWRARLGDWPILAGQVLAAFNPAQQSQLKASMAGDDPAANDLDLGAWPALTLVVEGVAGDVRLA